MKSFLIKLGAVSVVVVGCFYICLSIWGAWHDEWSGYGSGVYVSDGVCNIATVAVIGDLATFGTNLDEEGEEVLSTTMSETLSAIGNAEQDPNIQGIMFLVDSSGGSPSSGMMIADELKTSTLPSAAFVFDMAASAAYLAASGADTIIASPMADVGSIGVTMSYLQNTKQNADNGLEYVELASAKFKDSGSPDRPLTLEEKALFQRDLDLAHGEFVRMISENRNLSKDEVAKLADGTTLPAPLALESKLIDAIGNKETAREWFANELGLSPEEVIFCQ